VATTSRGFRRRMSRGEMPTRVLDRLAKSPRRLPLALVVQKLSSWARQLVVQTSKSCRDQEAGRGVARMMHRIRFGRTISTPGAGCLRLNLTGLLDFEGIPGGYNTKASPAAFLCILPRTRHYRLDYIQYIGPLFDFAQPQRLLQDFWGFATASWYVVHYMHLAEEMAQGRK